MPLPEDIAQLICVSSYTRFDNLAHGPQGTQAKYGMYTYMLDPDDGQLLLLSVDPKTITNPAFSRYNPAKDLLYTCTESVRENGQIVTYGIDYRTGKITQIGSFDAQGTSTCYITLDLERKHILVVNYWDASLKVMRLDDKGLPAELVGNYEPNAGRAMVAKDTLHVNHSRNDLEAQKERQADFHSHALVLDSVYGRVAYVPDLGKDVIWQFRYDPAAGSLTLQDQSLAGPPGRAALGPRYLQFHPKLHVAYVINELSCEVSVFAFDAEQAKILADTAADVPTLNLIQTVLTVPDGFPTSLNTCGRIAVHAGGDFVLAANRGHDSIAVFKVDHESEPPGQLELIDIQHTRGRTPRHFKFDISGQWLVAANQDTDSLNVFHFNTGTGQLNWTGHTYHVPSPNFVEVIKAKGLAKKVRSQ
eukprot:CAMPEP_0170593066 /NCGR_PEP_ID=MMETSP0224-20130122/13251_1 /TAXON_ID=285029 /ORGANISM="Togula jolla, Strain CCCM 725" /LENGTH=417 /DNA_ID=CAMNT_0010916997 /DNA_START=70 /DNA_END=1324 /DNA_ORIENTATION=-